MPPIPVEQLSPYPNNEVTTQVENKLRSKVRTPHQPRAPPQAVPDCILRERNVRERVGLSHSTIWRKIRSGEFPAPVRLGPQSVGWIEREVDGWIAERVAQRA
ncbi:AlpA family transcriptional regulator [Bradyrhizobium quebecense]|uniref:AlpA family transcriptional regulator n=1 Tax=Bradyrhizobium quebecense TaxID=2748629 RepID=A0A973WP00_9BRAD|nr:AlpA family transcriptional regulator [Bradyrhizobium quebecense]UGA46127.1 AlpA family transcriptional regulator [Bradyrhizobium quebecense]